MSKVIVIFSKIEIGAIFNVYTRALKNIITILKKEYTISSLMTLWCDFFSSFDTLFAKQYGKDIGTLPAKERENERAKSANQSASSLLLDVRSSIFFPPFSFYFHAERMNIVNSDSQGINIYIYKIGCKMQKYIQKFNFKKGKQLKNKIKLCFWKISLKKLEKLLPVIFF